MIWLLIFIISFYLDGLSANLYDRYDEIPYHLSEIPHADAKLNQFTLDYHMTRYTMTHPDHLIPWIRQFDLILTHQSNGGFTQIFSFHANDKSLPTDRTLKVHCHSDPRHHKFLIGYLMPFFEYRYEKTNQGVAIFSGGGDASVGRDVAVKLLSYKSTFYWRLENNGVPWDLVDSATDPRVMEIPIGIHWRQSIGDAKQLRDSIANKTDLEPLDEKYLEYHEFHRKLKEASNKARSTDWSARSDRILFCFGGRDNREPFIHWAIHNCSICDVCAKNGSIAAFHVDELWDMYGKYKFIVSPHGNGFDCGRSWEIMLMGAIPIIHFFPGVRGYENANLSVIVIDNETLITESNQQRWLQEHTRPNELYKLSRDYWIHRAFTFNDTKT